MDPIRSRFDRTATGVLAAAVIVSQGIHFLNGSAFWDGTMFLYAHETGSHEALFEMRRQHGSLATYFIHPVLGLIDPAVIMYRAAFVCSMLTGAWLFYDLLRLALRIPRVAALMAATFAVVLPFVPIAFDVGLVEAYLLVAAFLGGCRLLVHLQSSPRPAPLERLAAHALLAWSFFYGTFLMLALLASAADCALMLIGTRHTRDAARHRVVRWLDFHALPVAFAVVKNIFWRPYGEYANYNAIRPLTRAQVDAWIRVPVEFANAFAAAVAAPLFGYHGVLGLVCLVTVILALLVVIGRRSAGLRSALAEVRAWSVRARLMTGLAGLGFLYLTALPLFLVGRTAMYVPVGDQTAFNSRDNMVIVFVAGLLLAVIVFSGRRGGWVRLAIATAIGIKLAAVQAATATEWLKEDLTLRLLRAALAQEINVRNAQVVVYYDHTTRYNHLDWLQFAHLMRRTFGDETRIGLPPFEVNRCAPLAACLETGPWAPTGHPSGRLRGLRNAPGCGRVVEVEVEWATPAHRHWWRDFRAAARGGPELVQLARRRFKVRADPKPSVPCRSPQS